METRWKHAFLWSANPIPLVSRNTENLVELYKEGAEAFLTKSVDSCVRQILTAIYQGKLEDLEIMLDAWDIRVMAELVRRLVEIFPSLDISWVIAKKVLLVRFQGLHESIISEKELFPRKDGTKGFTGI